jgi:hypothetical protein
MSGEMSGEMSGRMSDGMSGGTADRRSDGTAENGNRSKKESGLPGSFLLLLFFLHVFYAKKADLGRRYEKMVYN